MLVISKKTTPQQKTKFVEVRCTECGHISWWSKRGLYICTECGSKHGMIVNPLRMALQERRLDIQRKLINRARIDAFFDDPQAD